MGGHWLAHMEGLQPKGRAPVLCRAEKLFGDALYDPSLRGGTPALMPSSAEAALGGVSSFCNELLFPNEPSGCQAHCQAGRAAAHAVVPPCGHFSLSASSALLSRVQLPAPVTRCCWCKPGAAGGGGRWQGA